MKTVTKIEDFISSLMQMETGTGDWHVYPEIAGYKSKVKITNNILTFKGNQYNFNDYFKERGLQIDSEELNVVVAPKVDSKWIDVDNLFTVNMQVKNKMDIDLKTVLEDCYVFTTDLNTTVRLVPYYETFKSLYSLLDNLNFLDRSLRMADWLTIGLTIVRGEQKILYIKPPLEAITTIKEIGYNIGRTGVIVPIAKFEPVNFNGAMTLQATLHNSKILSNNKLQVDDIVTVKIKRQGHQNTEVTSILYPFNDKSKLPSLSKCPSCNSTLVIKKKNGFLICSNSLCREKLIKKILHWCSVECMDIKGLGAKYIEYLVREKIVTTVDDLYVLKKKDLLTVPGILDKMATNILKQIEVSKQRSLIDVFIGLGIDSIGRSSSKLLAWHLMSVYNLLNLNNTDIKKLSIFINEDQRDNLIDYLSDELNKEVLLNLSRHLNPKLPEIKTINHLYYKKSFILKGTFPLFGRDKIKNLLIRSGIKLMATESKDFDFCLYNDNRKMVTKISKKKTIKLPKLLLELIT